MNYYIIFLLSAMIFGVQNEENAPKLDSIPAQNVTTNGNNETALINKTQEKPIHQTVVTLSSALCTKCKCSGPKLILDCSNINLTKWFNQDELDTLQYGDVKFENILLNDNQLDTVEAFPQMLSVKKVELQRNVIKTIAKEAFTDLQSLESLDLSSNKLTAKALTPDIFKGKYSPASYEPLKNLRNLNLGLNLINSLHPDLFVHFPNLENLTLTSNPFRVIDGITENAIASVYTLKVLDMSYLQLSILPNYIFNSPADLEILYLNGNFFKTLPEAIQHAVNLRKLNLNENLFTEFSDENVFPHLQKLEELYISYCPNLVNIGKGAFSNLENLKKLYLTNNIKLNNIHPNSMCRQRNNTIDFDFPPIENLYLHNNNLSVLEKPIFGHWDNIKIIDLRFNPWKCDCDNDFIINDLFTQILYDTPTLGSDVNCSTPDAWKGVPIHNIHEKKTNLRCEDKYGNHPENDGSILVGILIGLLVGIPLAFAMVFIYKRGCFGLLRRYDSVNYNRAFYSKTNLDEHI